MRPFLLLAYVLTWPLPVAAATLRTATTLEQAQVRLADLFDEAGPSAGRVIGTGPTPGNRIVVEAAQAAAIARQFGIDWRPSTNTERVVIDRPGRLIPREDVLALLRAALTGVGAPEDADIDLPDFASPLVATDAVVQNSVEQVNYDQTSGRFTATLAISATGEQVVRQRIAGRLVEMFDAIVPRRKLAVGAVIGADDLQTVRMRTVQVRGDIVRDPSQALGMAVRRIANPGQPLLLADIGRPMVVLKGTRVTMLLQSPGLTLAALGQAMEAGGLGDRISVLNPVSGAIVVAEILAPDEVRVSPGSIPRLPSRVAPIQVSQR